MDPVSAPPLPRRHSWLSSRAEAFGRLERTILEQGGTHTPGDFDGGWLRHGATTTAVTPTTCATARRCDDGVLAPLTASECDDDDVADAGPDAVDGGADAGPGGGEDGPDSGADAGPGGGEDAGPGGGADAGMSPGTVDGGDADPDDSDDDSNDDDDDGNVDDGAGRAAGAVRDESCGAGGAAPGPVTLLAWVACAGRWRRRRRA